MHPMTPPSPWLHGACVALLLAAASGCDGDADAFQQPTYADTQRAGLFIFEQARLDPETCAPLLNESGLATNTLDISLTDRYVLTPKLYNESDEPILITEATLTYPSKPDIGVDAPLVRTQPVSGYIPPNAFGTTDILAVSVGSSSALAMALVWDSASDPARDTRSPLEIGLLLSARGLRTGHAYSVTQTVVIDVCAGCLLPEPSGACPTRTVEDNAPFDPTSLRVCRFGQDTPVDCYACLVHTDSVSASQARCAYY